jgi:hypothetical protein
MHGFQFERVMTLVRRLLMKEKKSHRNNTPLRCAPTPEPQPIELTTGGSWTCICQLLLSEVGIQQATRYHGRSPMNSSALSGKQTFHFSGDKDPLGKRFWEKALPVWKFQTSQHFVYAFTWKCSKKCSAKLVKNSQFMSSTIRWSLDRTRPGWTSSALW